MKIESRKLLLTAIIPIGRMNGNLTILKSWISKISNFPLRVILIHDFQDESTAFELKELAAEHLGLDIIQISGSFGSPGAARNSALSLVDSEWVAFWDCDDSPLLNEIFNAIYNSDSSVEILVGGFITRNIDGSLTSKRHSTNPSAKSVSINPGVWRMVFKSELVANLKFDELMLAEDQLYLSKMNFVTRKVKYISNPFYEYYMGGVNQLTKNPLFLKDLIVASDEIIKELSNVLTNEQMVFNLTLVLRQQTTVLKKGDHRLKLRSIYLIIKFFAKSDLNTLKLGFFAVNNLVAAARNSKLL
jgi:glycosyltransferase involved in cell wall biosynthesis